MNSRQPARDGGAPSPRYPAIVAALCALALVVLSTLVGKGPLPIDLTIRDALHVGGPIPLPLDILNAVGGALVWDSIVAVIVVGLWLGSRRLDAIWVGSGVVVAEALATVVKLVVDRQRPPGIAVVDLVTQASFPSGHVTRVVVTGALLAIVAVASRAGLRTRIASPGAVIVLAILIGIARVASGEHWPTDVAGAWLLAGAVIGGAVAVRGWLRGRGRVRLPRPVPAPHDEERRP